MSIETIRGTSSKPVSSDELARILSQLPNWSGRLFVGYPIIGTPDGPHPIDALLVSVEGGIVVFDLIEGAEPGDFEHRQDDSANKVEALLKLHRELMHKGELAIPISTISFAPGIQQLYPQIAEGYPLANSQSLVQEMENCKWPGGKEEVFRRALSTIENIRTIRQSKTRRSLTREDSRGARLKRLEDSIATMDSKQSQAFIETVNGVQRIRGLAGAGKTIVLARKAAYLHAKHPEWRIAVTFHTRSLKDFFRDLIYKFSLGERGEEPDWEKLRIVHAWGASGGGDRDGIYFEFCRTHGADYFDFQTARRQFPQGKEFSSACQYALSHIGDAKQAYDVILVDEAQDLPVSFLRLCYEFLNEPKRLVYAYDELQKLSGESLPAPEDVFGRDADGLPKVRFDSTDIFGPKRDIILDKCYRNSRPVLVTAHALGFGIYRNTPKDAETGLIQMFDHPQLWEEIGYDLREGELSEGSTVTLVRPPETSPRFLEDLLYDGQVDLNDLIRFIHFESEEEQAEWLANAIRYNLEYDELKHNDVVVINPDPLSTRKKVGPIRWRLLNMGINSHLVGVDTGPDTFFLPSDDSVTFTGIYRSKGNEAGMIYIVNAQDCHAAAWNLANIRNQLFTAITRSKAWVRVLGVGSGMAELMEEYERLKVHDFELQFVYPTQEQREQLQIVNRDMTMAERKRIQNSQQSIEDLIQYLESGSIRAEDFDEETVAKLRELLERA